MIRQFWTILDMFELNWTLLDIIGHPWTKLDKNHWAKLDIIGQNDFMNFSILNHAYFP